MRRVEGIYSGFCFEKSESLYSLGIMEMRSESWKWLKCEKKEKVKSIKTFYSTTSNKLYLKLS